ncbi:phage holin [Pediococcus pentosaceus]|uniref:phage holin n=1 Tax=Pediococcus pentosaceus TaxID=1255 RepID=UPI002B4BF64D|nr:phage holin [Pediococcus pentosaceus]MEB3377171.1 phage holin [Pediococcus pentosaceus]
MMKKISFKNADGSLNGKLIAGIVSLLIVLVQQLMAAFGFNYPVNWQNVVGIINTVLTLLGMMGVISDVTVVSEHEGEPDDKTK